MTLFVKKVANIQADYQIYDDNKVLLQKENCFSMPSFSLVMFYFIRMLQRIIATTDLN